MQNTNRYIHDKLRNFYNESEVKSFTKRILESVSGLAWHKVLLCKDNELLPNQESQIEDIISRLQKYEPIQYILGETEFYGLPFIVNKNVLIPRPETEELVDLIIKENSQNSLFILDIGTGSGCIAISLAKHLPLSTVYAIDISSGALETAQQNATKNEVKVNFFEQDIFKDFSSNLLPHHWDLIVSNPPYVTPVEKSEMASNVLDYEPHSALFVPDSQPLLFYEKIADFGLNALNENGKIYVETSSVHGKATAQLFIQKGYKSVVLLQDILNNDRIVQACL